MSILAYYSVSGEPLAWIAPPAVSPTTFEAHLDALVGSGASTMTVSELVDAIRRNRSRFRSAWR